MMTRYKNDATDINEISRLDYSRDMRDLDDLLAQNLRQIRNAMGMTQEQFAHAMGTTQANISRLESGENFKRMKVLGQMLKSAGADPADLLKMEGEQAADLLTAEIRRLLPVVGRDARESILSMLRVLASTARREAAV